MGDTIEEVFNPQPQETDIEEHNRVVASMYTPPEPPDPIMAAPAMKNIQEADIKKKGDKKKKRKKTGRNSLKIDMLKKKPVGLNVSGGAGTGLNI